MEKKAGFESLFRLNFEALCKFGMTYINDLDPVKDLVHEVFVKLWERMDKMPKNTNFKGYLYTSVRNRCFNYLRDRKQHLQIEDTEVSAGNGEPQTLMAQELKREIDFAMNLIPDKCREIFRLSREEELTYAEIARKQNISVKTVEAQVSKALKILRNHLSDFLSVMIILLLVP